MHIDTSMTKTIASTTQRVERDGDTIHIRSSDGFRELHLNLPAANTTRITVSGWLGVGTGADEFVFNGSLADLKKMLRKAPTVHAALHDSRLIL